MKMRDAFELHPELQATIQKIDPTFAKPNVMCKTMWNKLKDINNSKIPLICERTITVTVSVKKNKNTRIRTLTENTFGSDFDAAVAGKLSKYNNIKRYSIESIIANSYNSDVYVQLSVVCEVEEEDKVYQNRQKMLDLKKLFSSFICEDMKEAERNAENIKREKQALKKAYDDEVKLLKQKYMQK